MPTVRLTGSLRSEYHDLFQTCQVRPDRADTVGRILEDIGALRQRYDRVTALLGGALPWQFVALIHNMEASLDLRTHLHNGDPLSARTVQQPAGYPRTGSPPFSWEESAVDALRLKGLDRWTDFSLAGMLYKLEEYNGWGYRLYHPHVLSAYLWGGSNHYTSGKYVADGTWSDTAVSRQIGAAVLLRRMAETGLFEPTGTAASPEARLSLPISYAPRTYAAAAEQLQVWLNTMPGIHLKVDGLAGPRTSEAFHEVTGHYLLGDRRA